jgi:hypothetical protein
VSSEALIDGAASLKFIKLQKIRNIGRVFLIKIDKKCDSYPLTNTYLLHRSPLQHSTQLQSSYQFLVQTGVNAYKLFWHTSAVAHDLLR